MSGRPLNIIIVESSGIIFEGISSILANTAFTFNIFRAENLSDIEKLNLKNKADIILINPNLIQNQSRDFFSLKNKLTETAWISIVYTFIDPRDLSSFDGIININDTPDKIIGTIQSLLTTRDNPDKRDQEFLTDREIDVLKLLVSGNANKEIADKLNISTHTVISHRKNISQKTGIKSVSGLTIYAVINNIISINNYRE